MIHNFLHKLQVFNYKNITENEFIFDKKINCLVGDNGVGKTNVLDTVYHLSIGKSYFKLKNDQIINNDSDFLLIEGDFECNEKKENIICSIKRGGKKVLKRNSKVYKKFSNHIGLIPVVMISPYDTDLINEGSIERRKFINSIISQNDKSYLQDLIDYNKIIQNRNKLLKNSRYNTKSNLEMIDVYDDKIIELSDPIHEKRISFVKEFLPYFLEKYNDISSGKEDVSIYYKSDLNDKSIKEILKETLKKDFILQYTSAGIHKDDLILKIDNNPVKKFGSQGQQKSFIIALKLAQFEYLKVKTGISPILLMDDIFDKLDFNRVKNIVNLVNSSNFGQLFISDTDNYRIVKILESLNLSSKIFRL